MAHFLSIILRNQFNLFYRFGHTFIPKSELVEFDGNISDEIKERIVLQFATTTPFEYDEEYLILHLEKSISDDRFIQFEIQDIVEIYPLSLQAKTSIESKIDQRIKLEKPIFESVLPEIESEIKKREVEKAISALWTICKIENPLEKYLSDIGIENIFKGLEHRKKRTKANKIQNGNYWEYLIAYDRFDYFPNTTLGCFYDAGQIFAFSKGHTTFEGSGVYTFLEKLKSENSTVKLEKIIEHLETEEILQNYVSQTTSDNIKQYIVAPLYLKLRNEIRNSEDITQTSLFRYLDKFKKFGDSFYYVIILLGAFFGFRKFYDLYYESLNLRFYKSYKIPTSEVKTEERQEQVEKDEQKVEDSIVENEKEKVPSEEIQIEAPVNNADLTQKDEQEYEDNLSQYRKIIENALKEKSEIKLADLVTLINEQTGRDFNNTNVKGIVEQMGEFEICKIDRAYRVRRKNQLDLYPMTDERK